ncbi:MAG: hypothetical protein JSW07_05170 [bacterium]|nr:MAG: hypothetical protein JSW07_05170 [bacterium]
MSNKKTLYIIGAGASSEAGLPTGPELKKRITNLLDIRFNYGDTQLSGDSCIYRALNEHVKSNSQTNMGQYLKAAWHIRDAMPQAISIDNFIDINNDDEKIELCGKLAIVRSILEAERNSILYIDPSNSFNRLNISNPTLKEAWYTSFMQLLTENCMKKNLPKRLESISLVVFNYDRCIEHFLCHSLQNFYKLEPNEAGKLVQAIEIYHPYGVVGNLPWQGDPSVGFGVKPNSQSLLYLASQIKTFTEGTDPKSSDIQAIRNNVNNADYVVFLGFAYHKQNMDLLMPGGPIINSSKLRSCFGTAKGISDHNCVIIKDELKAFYKHDTDYLIIDNKLDCNGLFEEFWRSLSLN